MTHAPAHEVLAEDRAADPAPAATDAVVTTRGLRVVLGRATVLHDLDLEVRRGEVLGLLGPNGAGKTTTVEVLAGFRRRTSGTVDVLGHDPERSAEVRHRISVVVQSWRDHAEWPAGRLLEHVAEHYDDPWDPAVLLDLVGLTRQRGQAVGTLSGGQRRRLDVALGLVGRPSLVFLDEPTTGFDPQARAQVHDLVRAIRDATDVSVVLTTHDLAEAETLCDRIAILVDGRLHATGTPAELAARSRAACDVRWTEDGRLRTRRVADPSALVWELHQRFAGPVPDLEVRRPSLQETYLTLVHRSGTGAADAPTEVP